jgi:monovalent cation:H+ antiporter-2, CPA2 family
MGVHIPFLRELAVFFAITAILVPIFGRLRLNPVLGFLIAGMMIGPFGLGSLPFFSAFGQAITFHDLEGIRLLGELGIVFLLFIIGLELSPQRLWAMRRLIFGLGTAQVIICAALIGATAFWAGQGMGASVVIGLSLALSSTAIVMKIIMDRHQFASPMGQTSFSILLLQDLAVVPIIFIIALLGQGQSGEELSLPMEIGKAVGVIAAVLLVGHYVVKPSLRYLAATGKGPEYFMAQILLILLVAVWATGSAGLSMALGAFLAGLVLAETEFRNQIEIDMEPFKGLFMGIFFMSVGMGLDLREIADNVGWLFLGVACLFLTKSLIIAVLCRGFGLLWPVAVRTGVTLGQAGEFAFILIGLAVTGGLIDSHVGQFILMVTGLTMFLTPAAYWLGEKFEQRLMVATASSHSTMMSVMGHEHRDHVVIVGYGRTGRMIGDILESRRVPYLALSSDGAGLARLRRAGKPVFFGDSNNIQALQKVSALQAKAIVLATDDPVSTKRALMAVRAHCPKVAVYARAHDPVHAAELSSLGATDVVLETVEMSLQMGGQVLKAVGLSQVEVNQVLVAKRQELTATPAPKD